MNVPGKNVSTTSGRVNRTRRTSCSSAAPWSQFANDCRTSWLAVSLPPRNQTFVIPSVPNARRASISRIAPKASACSVPTSFPPLLPRVPYATATRFPSSIARARYAVAAPSSSGCATTNKMSALYRSSAPGSGLASCAPPISGRNSESKINVTGDFIHVLEKCRDLFSFRCDSAALLLPRLEGCAPARHGNKHANLKRTPSDPELIETRAKSVPCPPTPLKFYPATSLKRPVSSARHCGILIQFPRAAIATQFSCDRIRIRRHAPTRSWNAPAAEHQQITPSLSISRRRVAWSDVFGLHSTGANG